MGKLIDQGMSVRDIAQPYLQSMGQLLEIDPNIDFLKDKTLQKAFSYKDPNAKNKGDVDPQPDADSGSLSRRLRQDPRWMQTDNAQKSFMDTGVVCFAHGIGHLMAGVSQRGRPPASVRTARCRPSSDMVVGRRTPTCLPVVALVPLTATARRSPGLTTTPWATPSRPRS
jgi:hypothetical protein